MFLDNNGKRLIVRILYHHRTLGDGAEGIHIREMVKAFRDLGHQVRVVSLIGEHTNVESEHARKWMKIKQMIPHITYELAEIAYNIVGTLRLLKAIREFKPDFIYERYNSYTKAGLIAARKARLPFILEVNAPVAYERSKYSYLQMKFPWLARYYEKKICSGADHVFTVSTALKEFLVKNRGVSAQKITVTSNAIDPVKYVKVNSGHVVREKFNLNRHLIVGFVGSLREWHGMDLLMKVIPEVLQHHPQCHFMIVGRGELEEQFRNFIKQRGIQDRVTLTGWVSHDEIPRYISAMDITLMPNSNFYGSPLKVLEYMAVGKPTIAPRLGPLEEIIQDGITGVLVEAGNEKALSNAILELLNDFKKRKKLGKNARKSVITNCSWKNNAEKVIEIYHKIVSEKA